jgi:hypothetical protein
MVVAMAIMPPSASVLNAFHMRRIVGNVDRRLFLKLFGLSAVVVGLGKFPTPQASETRLPGLYHISGRVRLQAPVVEIGGITNAQQISWAGGTASTATFSSFEHLDAPWQIQRITVSGGQLEAVWVTPIDFSA